MSAVETTDRYFVLLHDVVASTSTYEEFEPDAADTAYDRFFDLEAQHIESPEVHVILLRADSIETIKVTHGNLFCRPREAGDGRLEVPTVFVAEPAPGD